MNWEVVSAVAEAVGAIAVVASLIYLALQIRQNNAAVRASTYEAGLSHATNLTGLLLSNEALGQAWIRGLNAPGELDATDLLRFNGFMLRFFRMLESFHHQAASGLLDSELWEVSWRESLEYARKPGAIAWWRDNRQFFTVSFREFADREIEANV